MNLSAQSVLDFWFDDEHQPFWFAQSDEFDKQIRQKFAGIWEQASRGELFYWRADILGRLAEIIVLDQFSRNLHRQSPLAFAYDGMALVLAQELVAQSGFSTLSQTQRQFALLPFMHSESRAIHEQAVPLFAQFTHPTQPCKILNTDTKPS